MTADPAKKESTIVVSTPLILTKVLLPRLRSDLLRRPRLVNFIHAHIERKLILISASAGYGKTALLVDYAHDTDLPVCWYSLDSSDNDPRLFLEYLIASIRQRFHDFGQRTLTMLRESAGANLELAVNTLINEIQEQIRDYFVIILDDYQEVEDNPQVNAIVDRMLQYLPEHCHIILSTRTLPLRLSLTTLTAKQQAAGLGVNDLRFTPAEIQALARQNYQITLTDEEAAELAAHSEGWITGILLTTHTMWQGLVQSWVRVQGTGSQVFEYLADEVFHHQPQDIQDFLLATAILRELTPPLCDALLGTTNSWGMLNMLESRNLFISRLEGPGTWFRYHPLFREFLVQKLRAESPERYRALHQRAGYLARADGRWDAAIYHLNEAGEPEQVAETIEQVAASVYNRGQWRTLTRWMDLLPSSVQDRHPMLKLWRAKIYLEMEDLDQALRLLDEACQQFAAAGDSGHLATALVERGNVRSLMGDHLGAIADCETVLKMSEKVDAATVAVAHRVIGISYMRRGEFKAAAQELEESLRLSREMRYRENEGCLYHNLGTTYELIGDIERSTSYFQQALQYYEAVDRPWALANTLNSIGVSYYYRGEYEEAQKALEKALAKAREAGYTRIEAYALASLGDLYRDLGRLDEATQAYKDGLEIAQQVNESFIKVYILTALGDVYRMQGKRQRAQDLLRQALFLATHHDSGYEIGLCKLSLGTLHTDLGDISKAHQYLEEARELFNQAGAQREWARAELQIAYLHFICQEMQLAMSSLARVLETANRIHCDQFMLTDGVRLLPLYRYAIRRRIGLTRLCKIRDRIQSLQQGRSVGAPHVLEAPEPRELHLQVFALGPSRVFKDGRLLERSDWGSAVTKELFFFLLEQRQPLRKEQIIDVFWPEVSEERANSNFHSTTYRLRRALAQDALLYEDGVYRLNPDLEIWYDVEIFQELIAQAHQEEASERREHFLEEAIRLYHGDFMGECYSDWCIPRRESLRESYIEALLELGRLRILKGDPDGTHELCEAALRLDNFREDAYVLLMQACALRGDRGGIVRWYRRCQEALASELNACPLPETTQLYQRLIKQL
ncbi:MAG: tetratricopeptide repeat protein [Anaerolineae bacterium]|nr:tetratricopeptide repeat protein [Anaerolineae bacterium]MDW8098926.1 tetratricopeptide repeat protein [Anaerolineae bacterium]